MPTITTARSRASPSTRPPISPTASGRRKRPGTRHGGRSCAPISPPLPCGSRDRAVPRCARGLPLRRRHHGHLPLGQRLQPRQPRQFPQDEPVGQRRAYPAGDLARRAWTEGGRSTCPSRSTTCRKRSWTAGGPAAAPGLDLGAVPPAADRPGFGTFDETNGRPSPASSARCRCAPPSRATAPPALLPLSQRRGARLRHRGRPRRDREPRRHRADGRPARRTGARRAGAWPRPARARKPGRWGQRDDGRRWLRRPGRRARADNDYWAYGGRREDPRGEGRRHRYAVVHGRAGRLRAALPAPTWRRSASPPWSAAPRGRQDRQALRIVAHPDSPIEFETSERVEIDLTSARTATT
jgi:hypothetical protein